MAIYITTSQHDVGYQPKSINYDQKCQSKPTDLFKTVSTFCSCFLLTQIIIIIITRRCSDSAYIRQVHAITLSCTRLHVYIRASLVMYVCVQRWKWAREHCLIQASLGSSRTDWCVSTMNDYDVIAAVDACLALRDITVTSLYIAPQPPLRS